MDNIKLFISTSGDESQGYTFTDNNFKSIKFSNQLMDTTFDINPTVIEQYADVVFKDKGGVISSLVKNGVLEKDLKVYVYINSVLMYTYLTSSWELQAQDTTVTLHCNDPVKKLENKQTQLVEPADKTLAELIDLAFSWSDYDYDYESATISSIANDIQLEQVYVSYQDLLTFINKLCVVGFFRIYWKKDKFIIARCM